MNLLRISIAITLGILLFLSGCKKEDSAELKAMLESSAAKVPIVTGREVDRRIQDWQTNPIISMPKEPEVIIEYEPAKPFTQEDVYAEIIRNLKKNQWVQEDVDIPQKGFFKAALPQKNFSIISEVVIHNNSNLVSIKLRTTRRQ